MTNALPHHLTLSGRPYKALRTHYACVAVVPGYCNA